MAQSMFNTARAKASKQTWRAVLIGAAVPLAMLAGAPAVGAADIDRAETVTSEQLPPAPVPPPDPAALTKLLTCVTDLLAALDSQAPAPPGGPAAEAEQLPPLPPPPGAQPDIAALTKQCEDALAKLQPPAPPAPPAALPKD